MRSALRLGLLCGISLLAAGLLTGCGTVFQTLPARSATEQLLISTAADRALAGLPADLLKDKAVLVDMKNLDCYDKPYVLDRIAYEIVAKGGKRVEAADQTDIVLSLASGALSIDKIDYLFGIPAIPLPIPTVGTPLCLPEIALFKLIKMDGKAKLLVSAVDPKTKLQAYKSELYYGRSEQRYMWLLFTGPYKWGDLAYQVE